MSVARAPDSARAATTGTQIESEVKGVWFVTMRSWLLEHHGAEALNRVAECVGPFHKSTLTDPLPSAWYPEDALQSALRCMRSQLTLISDTAFLEALRSASELGISRFFRAVVRISSPPFLLRQVPTMWRQIRRGAGRVEVETLPGRCLIRYREFPYFDDPNYVLLTRGSLEALTRLCTGKPVVARIVAQDASSLDVEIAFG